MMTSASPDRVRARWLVLCAAMWGFAIGAAMLRIWEHRPVQPGQLPSLMTVLGLDARASFHFVAGVLIATIVVALAMRPVVRILAADDTHAFARNGAAAAMIAALWIATISLDLAWTIVPAAIAIAVFVALRKHAMGFSRADAILLSSVMPVFIALCDWMPISWERALVIAVATVLAIRLVLPFIRAGRSLPPAACFALAPLAMIAQTGFFARDQRYSPWPALIIAIVTPFLLRLFVRDSFVTRRRVSLFITFVAYPIAAFAYMNATSLATAERRTKIDFFEDGQHVAAAGEMLRGEKPYRDIIPPHGLIQDGLFDYFAAESRGVTLGQIQKVRNIFGGGNAIANYAIAAAATGSPHIGILAFFFAATLGAAGGTFRVLPALIALAFIVGGVRRRNVRLLAAGAVFAVIGVLTSLDFGTYALVALFFGIAVFGDTRVEKLAALRWSVIGAGATAAIASLYMLISGFFFDFIRVTLFEIAPLGPVYALPPYRTPAGWRTFRYVPEALAGLFDRTSFLYVVWVINFIALAAAIAAGVRGTPRRRAQLHALMVISSFVAICAISYAERQHNHYQFVVAPLMVVAIWNLSRSRERFARSVAPVGVLVILMTAFITIHLAISVAVRRARGPMEAGWTTSPLPRAEGAWFREKDAAIIAASHDYLDRVVGPDGTFFDFTNRGLLFFLLNRDIPVRQIEPAFYETEELQKEVIARIEGNPRVRAALVPKGMDDQTGVDIPNQLRAPLVWKYLQDHFRPDYEDDNIVFWRRK
jgi:hypothetical protein